LSLRSTTLALTFAILGCGGGPTPRASEPTEAGSAAPASSADSPPDELTVEIEAFLALDNDKAIAFAVGGDTDCVAKAKSVGDWRRAHTRDYKAMMKKLNGRWPNGPPEDFKRKYGDQFAKNKKAVMDAMLACSNDEEFGKMMDETKATTE